MRSKYGVQNRARLKTTLAAGLLLATPSWAASPGGIPFSGYATNIVGAAMTGTINARFYLSIGETYIWCAQYNNVPVSSGEFFLILGQTVGTETGVSLSAPACTSTGGTLAMSFSIAATALSSSNVSLQVTVQPQSGGDYETLGSGVHIGSSLFALNADALGGVAASSYAKFDTSGKLLAQNGTAIMSSSGAPLNSMIQTGVTSVATGTGLSGGPITTTGTVSLANTAVTPGSYTRANITVDAQGRLTAASNVNVPLASGVSGTLPTNNGGTGQTSFTAGDILIGNGASAISRVTAVPIANGGTNSTATATAGGVVYGTGTSMATTAAGTTGNLLASAGAGAPTWTNAPSVSSVTIGSGTVINNILHGNGGSSISCIDSCVPTDSTHPNHWRTVTINTGDTSWSNANTRIIANFHEGALGTGAVLGTAVFQTGDATIDAGILKLRYFCGCTSATVPMAYEYLLMR